MPPPIERIDVSAAELEAFLEQARPSLSEEAYQKLRAAIRTLAYVTELLEKQETTLARREEAQSSRRTRRKERGPRPWAQWRRGVSRSAEDPGSARDLAGGRCVSGRAVRRQGISAA
jgi:hypothetical protein